MNKFRIEYTFVGDMLIFYRYKRRRVVTVFARMSIGPGSRILLLTVPSRYPSPSDGPGIPTGPDLPH